MSLLHQLREYELRMRREGKKPVQHGTDAAADDGMPFMYAMQNVRWDVRLKGDGTVRDVQPRSSGRKGRELGLPLAAPNLVRAGSGAKPRLLMDNAEYVLGFVKKEGQEGIERAAKYHQSFRELVQDAADATDEPSVRAVAAFLNRHDPDAFRASYLETDFAPDTNVMFTVDGVNPLELPSVRRFWARQFAQDSSEGAGTFQAECLITGEFGPVMEREPVKIKGILGGQTSGMNFISANAQAFESYGLEASRIAPVKFEAAEEYASGLNRLLADPNTRLRVGGVTYAFWTKEGATLPVGLLLQSPDDFDLSSEFGLSNEIAAEKARPEQVRSVLWSALKGVAPTLEPGTAFYAVGLTPSGSRIAVRTHLTSTVQDAVDNLARYFASQSLAMVNPVGSNFPDRATFDLYALVGAMYRDPSKAHTAPDVDALVQFALSGQPLPGSFLVRLNARNRADEHRVTRPRAVLTKMVLLSRKEYDMQEENLEALDTARPEPAYHLGRLLAVLDDIQSSVMKANTTLVDRFYGSMSTTPYAVVGRLIQGSQAHLQRLRKDNEGAYFAKQRELEDVMGRLVDIPAKPLSTPQQALFALGYYHQRAHISGGIRERSAAKKEREAQAKSGAVNAESQNTPPTSPLFDQHAGDLT